MALIDPYTLEVGQKVTFRCTHTTDTTLYEGTIVSISTFDIACLLEDDLIPYQTEVMKVKPTIDPIKKLTFWILEYYQNDIVMRIARAIEWIDVSTLKIIIQDPPFDIRIYDRPIKEAETVINLLQAHGYTCNLLNQV